MAMAVKDDEGTDQFPGMPAPYELWRGQMEGGGVAVSYGPNVLFRFDPADRGLRNLAMVALTQAGVAGKAVAEVFGFRPEHVSRLRTKVAQDGSAALVPALGAPRKLSGAKEAKALRLADDGRTGVEIAAQLGVSASTISRLLGRRPRPAPQPLPFAAEITQPGEGKASPDEEPNHDGLPAEEVADDEVAVGEPRADDEVGLLPRIGKGEVDSAYAGAMLLHPFLDRVGAEDILSALPSPACRRYDATGLMLSTTFGFALGSSSLEGTKHLLHVDAGALVGLASFPHLRTLRPRLSGLAQESDPLAIQRAFAKGMLRGDDSPPSLFFCDEHFVAYTGAQPVAKGYNIRRHRCEPGRDDVFVTDGGWRAICFDSGEPKGLSVSLPGVLGQLAEVCGGARVMVGFDRGGSYPKVFAAIRDANMDWVTYRRAPLVPPTVKPKLSWTTVDGRRITSMVSDEVVDLEGYGPARQLSVYEGDKVVFQILTSDMSATAAALVRALRRRWSIENTFKYLEDHTGIHWLCNYEMDIVPDPRKVPNPVRQKAKEALKDAEAVLAQAERAMAQNFTDPDIAPREANAASPRLQRAVESARTDLADAKDALLDIPAKVKATDLDPDAKRARPHLATRALQMVCRLLAYNAELDLARHLDAYLDDLDEYRAITRNLLRLPGRISFGATRVTVSLRRPDSPRVARALGLLIGELNATPARVPGDRRPLTYRIEGVSA